MVRDTSLFDFHAEVASYSGKAKGGGYGKLSGLSYGTITDPWGHFISVKL